MTSPAGPKWLLIPQLRASMACLPVLLMIPALPIHAEPVSDRQSIQIHGHRGARARRPENTIAAFKYAIDASADFLEMDLQVTRDRQLIVVHDPVVNTSICCGHGIPCMVSIIY